MTRSLSILATLVLAGCAGGAIEPPPPPPGPPPLAKEEEAVAPVPARDMGSLTGFLWRATNADGTWQLTYRFRADGTYTASGHPDWHEAGRASVMLSDPERLVLRLFERSYDGKQEEPAVRELVFATDGASFLLNGDRYVRVDHVAAIAQEDEGSDDERL